MKWFKCYVDLKDHPKRKELDLALGTKYGLHHLILWFMYVTKYAKGGEVTHFKPELVADYCEWGGDAALFMDTLKKCNLIDVMVQGDGANDGAERLFAHDFAKEHASFLKTNAVLSLPENFEKKSSLEEKRREEKRVERDLSTRFARFWSVWPKRRAKAAAEKAWAKLSDEDQEAAIKAVPDHCRQADWKKDGGQFIPLPATWLNGQRWKDELEGVSKPRLRGIELCRAEGHFLINEYSLEDASIVTGKKCSRCDYRRSV